MIFYENTDDNQNPLLKRCSIANFLSAEVSTPHWCVITHYSQETRNLRYTNKPDDTTAFLN